MSSLYFTGMALGAAAHLFISPIPDVSTVKVLAAYSAVNVAIFSYLVLSCDRPEHFPGLVFSPLFSANIAFFLAAVTITVVRRLWFSPLSKFPGPKLAAITKLWEANQYRTGRAAVTKKKLHEKYGGDIVRVGPNEVSFNNVDAAEKVYAGNYRRGTFYENWGINGALNLHTISDCEKHIVWKRIWEKAFLPDALKEYNLAIDHHINKLIDRIKKSAVTKTEGNCTQFMENLVFDIMADLSFGEDARMQDGTGDGVYMTSFHKHLATIKYAASLRNLAQLLPHLSPTPGVEALLKRSEQMFADRQAVGISRKDIFRHLLVEDSETGYHFTQTELSSNANLIITAGTDTTTTVLTQTFRMLAREPRILKKMQREVDTLCASGKALTVETVKKLSYVSAVLTEALRLFNPIPSGIHATTPSHGVQIGSAHLPGNIQVQIPLLALLTDKRYFPKGNDFIPERWTGERPELIADRRAFIPFGYGSRACAGQELAMNVMRLVLARVVRGFNVGLGESYDEERWAKEWKDCYYVQLGALWLRFTSRR